MFENHGLMVSQITPDYGRIQNLYRHAASFVYDTDQ